MSQKTNIVLAIAFFAISACNKSTENFREEKLDKIRKDKYFQAYINKKYELIERLKEEAAVLKDNKDLREQFKTAQKNGKAKDFISSLRQVNSQPIDSLYKEIATNYLVVYYKYVINDKLVTKADIRELDLEKTSNKNKLIRNVKL